MSQYWQLWLIGGQNRERTIKKLCTNFVQSSRIILTFVKNIGVMTKKKDLYNLHCRVEHLTAEKLKAWSEELGYSVGEMIDIITKWYEEYSNNQDAELERLDVSDQLSTLLEKVERIEKKVGA